MSAATAAEDLDTMARTIWGEARNQPYLGKLAVAWVIRNRADKPSWWGKTIVGVCLQKYQFSCWLDSDPNYKLLRAVTIEDRAFRDCMRAAMEAYDRGGKDPVQGATHYHTLDTPKGASKWPPDWALELVPLTIVGDHKFYKEA